MTTHNQMQMKAKEEQKQQIFQPLTNSLDNLFLNNKQCQKQSMFSSIFAAQTDHLSITKPHQVEQIKRGTAVMFATAEMLHTNDLFQNKQKEHLKDSINFGKIQTTHNQIKEQKISIQQRAKNKISFRYRLQNEKMSICRFKFENRNSILLCEIGMHFYHQVVINKTVQCNYSHFHILFVMNNLYLMSHYQNVQSQQMETYNKYCVKKLLLPNMKAQLSDISFYEIMTFIIRARNTNREDIAIFIRRFFLKQQQIIKNICPYYYNIFALNLNKQIIFDQSEPKADQLIDYSVEFKHDKFYRGKFSRQDVFQVMADLQTKIKEKFNSLEM